MRWVIQPKSVPRGQPPDPASPRPSPASAATVFTHLKQPSSSSTLNSLSALGGGEGRGEVGDSPALREYAAIPHPDSRLRRCSKSGSRDTRRFDRSRSHRIGAVLLRVLPTIQLDDQLARRTAKSAMCRPIGWWRRSFQGKPLSRSAHHRRRSTSVLSRRSVRASVVRHPQGHRRSPPPLPPSPPPRAERA